MAMKCSNNPDGVGILGSNHFLKGSANDITDAKGVTEPLLPLSKCHFVSHYGTVTALTVGDMPPVRALFSIPWQR